MVSKTGVALGVLAAAGAAGVGLYILSKRQGGGGGGGGSTATVTTTSGAPGLIIYVTDMDTGQPVAGADVLLTGGTYFLKETATSSAGVASLIPGPGNYTLSVSLQGYLSFTQAITLPPTGYTRVDVKLKFASLPTSLRFEIKVDAADVNADILKSSFLSNLGVAPTLTNPPTPVHVQFLTADGLPMVGEELQIWLNTADAGGLCYGSSNCSSRTFYNYTEANPLIATTDSNGQIQNLAFVIGGLNFASLLAIEVPFGTMSKQYLVTLKAKSSKYPTVTGTGSFGVTINLF